MKVIIVSNAEGAIGDAVKIAKQLGYKIFIVPGGSLVKNY